MFDRLLVDPLMNALVVLYAYLPGRDFGLAVIALTILIRLVLWPLVNKQLHSQRAMQALAPDIARIKKQAKGDKQVEGKLLMELYKEKEISPFASMLPLLIQLPLLFALFVVLRDILQPGEISQVVYEPLRNLSGVQSVIAENGSFHPSLLGLVDLTKPSLVLALAAGLVQYIQTKQILPKKESDDPSAKVASMTSKIFPVMTAGFAMTFPSALALYWTTTSAVAILQQYIVLQKGEKELEEQTK